MHQALQDNPNPKLPQSRDQRGGNGGGKRGKDKCEGRGSGPQNQQDSKKGVPRSKQPLAKAKKLTSPGDQSPGHSDKYTLALNYLIHQVGNLDIQPRKTNVQVTFKVNSKRHKVPAYVDSGNSFFNCKAKETHERIGFTLSQLESSPTPAIRQAGGGATLNI